MVVILMTKKYYEVWRYLELGFASEHYRVASFLSKENAEKYAKKMNEINSDALYDVYEKEFMDGVTWND